MDLRRPKKKRRSIPSARKTAQHRCTRSSIKDHAHAACSSGSNGGSSSGSSSSSSGSSSGSANTSACGNTSTSGMPVDPTQWGLNPIYWSYARLLACQIQSHMKSVPGIENSHILYAHSLSKVELVGTIVRVVELNRMVKYTLDDSTGLVDCTYWKSRNQSSFMARKTGPNISMGMSVITGGDVVPSFTMLDGAAADVAAGTSLLSSLPLVLTRDKIFQLGDTVRVRGKLHKVPEHYLERYLTFSDREVTIQNIIKVKHSHEAILHRLSAIALSREFYQNSKVEIESQPAASAMAPMVLES